MKLSISTKLFITSSLVRLLLAIAILIILWFIIFWSLLLA